MTVKKGSGIRVFFQKLEAVIIVYEIIDKTSHRYMYVKTTRGLSKRIEQSARRSKTSKSIILLIITIIIQVRVQCCALRATANKCCCQPSRNNLRNSVIQVYLAKRTPFVMCRVTVVVVYRTGILIEGRRSIIGVRVDCVSRSNSNLCVRTPLQHA